MQNIRDKLIVALDVDSLAKAKDFVNVLYPTVKLFKIGGQLFTAYGPEAVKMVGEKGARVFLDLKFYDIPHTVFQSSSSGTDLGFSASRNNLAKSKKEVRTKVELPVFMMTVHISGGEEMLRAAVEGAASKAKELNIDKPAIVGVTILTSDSYDESTAVTVLERAKLAQKAGLDGVVCSVNEAAAVRKACGKDFIIVTPGIRPKGAGKNDQKRTATPCEAIKAGANFIVVGRPILEACDPLKAAKDILEELG